MAKFLSLQISSKQVRYACLEKKGKKLSLTKAGVYPLEKEITSAAEFTRIVDKIRSQAKISPAKIFLNIFRDDVVIHQIILPKMAKTELEEVIAGEIEKLPAFADKEFSYIYYTYGLTRGKVRAIFAALPQSMLDALIKGTTKTNIPLVSVEIAPLNLLGILYSLGDGKDKEGVAVVVDDKVSYLMVFFKKECKFFYTIGTGKLDLYKNGKLETETFLSWSDEIKRILKSYRVDYGEKDFDKAWLVWDSDGASDLDQHLNKELGLEVKKLGFEVIANFEPTYNEEELNSINLLCATPAISYLKNLVTEFPFADFLSELNLKKVIRSVVASSLIFMGIVGFILVQANLFYMVKKKGLAKKMAAVDVQITELEKETAQLRQERAELIETRERLLRQAYAVRMLNRISWSRVFGEVAGELPDEVALTSFKIAESGQVNLKGEALAVPSIAELMRKVDSSVILKDAKFDFLQEKKVEDKTLFSFGILANLKPESPDEKK